MNNEHGLQPQSPGSSTAAATPGSPADTATPQAASVTPDETALASARAETAALKAEVTDLKDRLLRAHAEMDNIRKRTDREKADAHKYAISKFAHDIVTVGDNFQRAIDTVPAGAAEKDPALHSFLEGVTMTERELINVLDRNGIKRIDPKGEIFNPHFHQAVMEMPNPDVPSGTVTQVFQPGYMIEDRILRPAMVVVAKGGMKQARPAEQTGAPVPPPANDDAPKAAGSDPGAGPTA